MNAATAIARNEFRQLRRTPTLVIPVVVMPLAFMAFMRGTNRVVLVAQGNPDATGAEHAVPGLTVMFVFFAASYVSNTFFREHNWHTWDRLRASPASTLGIVVGKGIPNLTLGIAQQAGLFTLGVLLLDLHITGSLLAVAAIATALATVVIALGIALTSLFRTSEMMNSAANVIAIVMAGLGGAFTPLSTLPTWAQHLAPATPTYWAMRGYTTTIQHGGGLADIALPVLVLLAFTTGLSFIGALGLRTEEPKLQ